MPGSLPHDGVQLRDAPLKGGSHCCISRLKLQQILVCALKELLDLCRRAVLTFLHKGSELSQSGACNNYLAGCYLQLFGMVVNRCCNGVTIQAFNVYTAADRSSADKTGPCWTVGSLQFLDRFAFGNMPLP